ncbi:hypothetical protein DFS34DRAFT_631267 [Phlyctochytrium arcticum]|nr:hypothetical protein DFS34DRAFT_631267 [Phlyctochytrium arcticum]
MVQTNMIALVAAALAISSVNAHGFLSGIGRLSPSERGQVRGYSQINSAIDNLRNPASSFCRGTAKGTQVPVTLSNGGSLTLTQAFSIGAQHIGPCAVEIVDANNPADRVTITKVDGDQGCARPPLAQSDSDKSAPATSQCPGRQPAGLVTNDMCLHYWTFNVQNADKIKCTDCILRWTWDGTHISRTNPEHYENCIDIKLTRTGGGGGGAPAPAPPAAPKSTVAVPAPSATPSKAPTAPSQPTAAPKSTTLAAAPTTANPPKANPPVNPPKVSPTVVVKLPVPSATPVTPAPGPSAGGCGVGDLMVCQDSGFFVCYPGTDRPAQLMQCAPGTKCQQAGKFINCVAQ